MTLISLIIAVLFCVNYVLCAEELKYQDLKQTKRSIGSYGLGSFGAGLPSSLGLTSSLGLPPSLGLPSSLGLPLGGLGGSYAPAFGPSTFSLGGPSSFGPAIAAPAILPQLPPTISHNTVTTVQRPFAVPGKLTFL